MDQPSTMALPGYPRVEAADMIARARTFRERMVSRRTVRDFAPDPVPREVIEEAIRTAGSAPSGTNLQPWHFAVIAPGPLRQRIREAAEAEERAFYAGRAGGDWLAALAPLGTDWRKPFLETAPWLIAIFVQRTARSPDGRRIKHYYASESVGIATGFLLAALHHAGLATLTHTPAPMGFLNTLCGRPSEEKPFVLVVTGFPVDGCRVPVAATVKKPLDAITNFL